MSVADVGSGTVPQRGEEGWHAAHAEGYGERWGPLHEALHRDVEHLCFLNPFLPEGARKKLEDEYRLRATAVPGAYNFEIPEDPVKQYRATASCDEDVVFVQAERDVLGRPRGELPPFFFVDGASVVVARALGACESDRVLEACAGAGGRALVIASAMFARHHEGDAWDEIRGTLVCNEVLKDKAARMQSAIWEFLPPTLFNEGHPFGPRVLFTSADPSTPSNSMERSGPYDRILLHAPCVSDRALTRGGAAELGKWSAGKVKIASEKQLKLVHNALWLLREGGLLIYCTTALSHEENDGVVEKLLLKARCHFVLEVLPLEGELRGLLPSLLFENTDWGTRILPDRTPYGPVYLSRIRLIQRTHPGAEASTFLRQ